MSGQIRVGVVGTSWWADMMHLSALKSHLQAEIVAICGRNADRAGEMAQKYEIPQIFTDYTELINKSGAEAIVVSTPDDLHYPITMAALDAGLHVICEKPLALRLEHAKKMYEKANAASVVNMTYFTWRWLPCFRYLCDLVQEGYLGQVYHGHFGYMMDFGRRGKDKWSWNPQRSLGILGSIGSHMIDLARSCMGEVTRVSAHLGTFEPDTIPENKRHNPVNDAALLTLEFENGSQGVIHASGVAYVGGQVQEQFASLHGEDGMLEVRAPFQGRQLVRGARGGDEISALAIPESVLQGIDSSSTVREQFNQIFTQQSVGCRLFIDAILSNRPVSPSFYDGYKVQEIIHAAMQSNQQARWIDIAQ